MSHVPNGLLYRDPTFNTSVCCHKNTYEAENDSDSSKGSFSHIVLNLQTDKNWEMLSLFKIKTELIDVTVYIYSLNPHQSYVT